MVSPQRGCQLGLAGGVQCRATDRTSGRPTGELGTNRQSPSLSPSSASKASLSNPEWARPTTQNGPDLLQGPCFANERSQGDKVRQGTAGTLSLTLGPLLLLSPRTSCPSSVTQHVLSYCPFHHPILLQVLSQLTPQTVTEIDGLLGSTPHSKK